MSEDNTNADKMPLSRFWACFFCCSIFALLWTQKIQKTRKWILLFSMFVSVWFIADDILYSSSEPTTTMDESINSLFYFEPNPRLESFMYDVMGNYFPDAYIDDIVFLFSLVLIVLYDVVIWIGVVLVNFYFMFKWVTQYNLKNYGYKSKKDWKKANLPSRNYVEKIKQFGSKTGENLKDAGSKTGENLKDAGVKTGEHLKDAGVKTGEHLKDAGVKTGEHLKDAGVKTGEKISKTATNFKYERRITEEYVRHQIKEWHDLMRLDILSESEFEQKKAELLKELDKS